MRVKFVGSGFSHDSGSNEDFLCRAQLREMIAAETGSANVH
jgi:hypothetical protein